MIVWEPIGDAPKDCELLLYDPKVGLPGYAGLGMYRKELKSWAFYDDRDECWYEINPSHFSKINFP